MSEQYDPVELQMGEYFESHPIHETPILDELDDEDEDEEACEAYIEWMCDV